MTILYQIDNKKQLRVWSIKVEGHTLIIEHGLLKGQPVRQEETILEGKGGRSIDEQIKSRLNSRINKQLAKGYRHTIEEAEKSAGKNELNHYKPMLAQQLDKVKNIDIEGAVYQRKLDGNRMLVTRQNGELHAYTRNGKTVATLGHILEELEWITEGQTIDGEVYLHGTALKDINSRMRRAQKATKDLKYHIYDVVDDKPFKERFKLDVARDIIDSASNIIIEPYWDVTVISQQLLFNTVRAQGYEGLMMRLDGYGYQAGKRSKGLLKIKQRHDAEFEIIDVEVSKDGHGIFVLMTDQGRHFKCLAPGSHIEREIVAVMPENYIGKYVTVSYAYITDYGIPFHPVCERYRDD